jgi:hypothetical protein
MPPAGLVGCEVGLQQVMASGKAVGSDGQARCSVLGIVAATTEGAPGCPHTHVRVAKRRTRVQHGQSMGVQQMTRVIPIVSGERFRAAHHHDGKTGQFPDHRRGGVCAKVPVTGRGVDVPAG